MQLQQRSVLLMKKFVFLPLSLLALALSGCDFLSSGGVVKKSSSDITSSPTGEDSSDPTSVVSGTSATSDSSSTSETERYD